MDNYSYDYRKDECYGKNPYTLTRNQLKDKVKGDFENPFQKLQLKILVGMIVAFVAVLAIFTPMGLGILGFLVGLVEVACFVFFKKKYDKETETKINDKVDELEKEQSKYYEMWENENKERKAQEKAKRDESRAKKDKIINVAIEDLKNLFTKYNLGTLSAEDEKKVRKGFN
ncbi:MAG: hypothetical protein II988_02000 [Clostridia bacterium]|nr:hypothetical protein [Clostridia bacterium]